jgi:O-antigen ligase
VYVFLGYWLCWVAAQAPGARRTFGMALGIGAGLACAIGIGAYFLPAVPPWLDRWASGPGDQSSALLTLMPLVLIAIWLTWRENMPRGVRSALWALMPLMLLAAYATLNRTVWLGFAAQLAVIAALLLLRTEMAAVRKGPRFRLNVALVAAALLGSVAVLMVHVQERRVQLYPGTTGINDPRLAIWASAIDSIEERPIEGHGFGRGIDRRTLKSEFDSALIWHAHNLVLETAVETGLVGAGLILLLIFRTAYKGWRFARGANARAAAYGTALVAVVIGMIARNTTDTLLVRQNALFYWGVVALLLALGALARKPGEPETTGR